MRGPACVRRCSARSCALNAWPCSSPPLSLFASRSRRPMALVVPRGSHLEKECQRFLSKAPDKTFQPWTCLFPAETAGSRWSMDRTPTSKRRMSHQTRHVHSRRSSLPSFAPDPLKGSSPPKLRKLLRLSQEKRLGEEVHHTARSTREHGRVPPAGPAVPWACSTCLCPTAASSARPDTGACERCCPLASSRTVRAR